MAVDSNCSTINYKARIHSTTGLLKLTHLHETPPHNLKIEVCNADSSN